MSIGLILAIVAGVILLVVLGILLGMYIFVNYLISPKGFVKDLTGNEPPAPRPPVPDYMMRMHLEALQNEHKDETK